MVHRVAATLLGFLGLAAPAAVAQSCADGTVGSGAGPETDVLFINGSSGLPGSRIVPVGVGEPITVRLDSARGGPIQGRYVVWVWTGPPSSPVSLVARGQLLGCLVNPAPVHSGASPQPIFCLRGTGVPPIACGSVTEVASPPTAPWAIARSRGSTSPRVFTLQGVLEDDQAANATGYSVTNAVTLVVGSEGRAPFVPPPPGGAATRYVSPSGSDSNDGLTPATAWRNLQHAADSAGPGDVVKIADGSYSRFTITVSGMEASPVILRATGAGAVIDNGTSSSTSPDRRDAIKIDSCTYLIVHGLRTVNAFRSGVRITNSLHVTVQAGVFANGGTWGIFTDYSDDVSLVGNECYGSVREHGIYHSNSGDRAIIRGNFCHDNNACGIQINADPAQQNPDLGTRGDGIAENCIVERNRCEGNGAAGGAALNFASIRSCTIRNNLLVNNLGQSGIVLWDDGFSPQYGSKDNRVFQNTVVFASGQGRFCLALRNGSTGNHAINNVFRGGRRGSISFRSDCLPGFVEDFNLCSSADGYGLFEDDETGTTYTLSQWQAISGGAVHDVIASPAFSDAASGNFTLAAGSPGVDQGTGTGVRGTHDGGPRPIGLYDMGCFER